LAEAAKLTNQTHNCLFVRFGGVGQVRIVSNTGGAKNLLTLTAHADFLAEHNLTNQQATQVSQAGKEPAALRKV